MQRLHASVGDDKFESSGLKKQRGWKTPPLYPVLAKFKVLPRIMVTAGLAYIF
jgi:hypothetical protein